MENCVTSYPLFYAGSMPYSAVSYLVAANLRTWEYRLLQLDAVGNTGKELRLKQAQLMTERRDVLHRIFFNLRIQRSSFT
jgi:hypothetical protein